MIEKEKFLNEHMDEIQKNIWLLEVDEIITARALKENSDPEEEQRLRDQSNQIWQKINGMEYRKRIIMKVINGTIKVDDTKTEDKPTHTVSE